MLAETTAPPSCPVREHRPINENVIHPPYWPAKFLSRFPPLSHIINARDSRGPSKKGHRISIDGVAALAASVVLFGAAWPITRLAFIHGANATWFGAGRAALSACSAIALLTALRRLRWPARGDIPAIVAVGLLQIAGFFAFAHEGAARVPAGRTAVLANATTIWMPLLSLLLLHESIPPRHWVAAAIGLAGVGVLVGPSATQSSGTSTLLGDAFLLAAALSFALAIALVRRRPPRSPMIDLLPWCFALGAVVLLPYAYLRAPERGIGADPVAWSALLAIGAVAGPIGTWCVMRASALLPPMVASVGFLGAPAVGLVLATVWLGETLSLSLLLGFLLILTGILIAVWPKRVRR